MASWQLGHEDNFRVNEASIAWGIEGWDCMLRGRKFWPRGQVGLQDVTFLEVERIVGGTVADSGVNWTAVRVIDGESEDIINPTVNFCKSHLYKRLLQVSFRIQMCNRCAVCKKS